MSRKASRVTSHPGGLPIPATTTNVTLSHVLGANMASSSGLEDADVVAKKKDLHITQRWESQKQQCIFQKEVRESVVAGCTPKVRIPTNASGEVIGLKGVWQQTVKDVSYWYLDLTIQQFQLHTQKQWDAIYAKLAKQFWYDPPLEPKVLETYMREHFSSYWRTLRRLWEAQGDDARPENCPTKMWNANVHYWRSPNANRESEQMCVVHAKVWKAIAQGWTPLAHFMELQVSLNHFVRQKLLSSYIAVT